MPPSKSVRLRSTSRKSDPGVLVLSFSHCRTVSRGSEGGSVVRGAGKEACQGWSVDISNNAGCIVLRIGKDGLS